MCIRDRTDRQTDGIAIAYTRYSIYAVARKNTISYTRIGHNNNSNKGVYCTMKSEDIR